MNSSNLDQFAGLSEAQLAAFWMPTTGNRQFKKDPRILTAAQGHYYTSADGRQIFDGLSGLWTCGLGHAREELTTAVAEQMQTLDYSPAFQFGHPLSFQLAEKVAELMPGDLNRIFFTGSGSESVDTALKIARAYWHKRGKASKTRFIGRSKGYHGVNYGGISVGGLAPNRAMYGEGVAAAHLPHTITPENHFSRGQPEHGAQSAEALLELIALHDASTIAAVIVEPMAGSAGVIPPPVGYLQRLREICDAHDILLIFDEVICGFGRVGAWTGAEAFGVTPDIITLAKQLTNGVIPMGAVAVRQDIYDTFMDNAGPEYVLELPHGYTYSAHPVACAAGLASLDLLEREDGPGQVKAIAPHFESALHALKDCPHVTDLRNCGLAGGISLAHSPGEPLLRPFKVAMAMWQRGYYLRYGGDTLQIAPPFGVSLNEIDELFGTLAQCLAETD